MAYCTEAEDAANKIDVGDRLHVRLISVDIEEGDIDFRKIGSQRD